MGLQIDWYNHLILVTSPTVSVDAQTLHDFIEDQMATPVGALYGDIIQPEGKIEDPSSPGVYSQIILILNSPWQIQFWGGSGYTKLYGAKIVGGLADEVIKASGTAGDVTVLESPVDGVTVATGSGVTQGDKDDIIQGVWDEQLSAHSVNGSFGAVTSGLLGLGGQNVKWTNVVHDANNNLTSATITHYTDETLTVVSKVWQLTATYDAQGRLTSHQMVEVP